MNFTIGLSLASHLWMNLTIFANSSIIGSELLNIGSREQCISGGKCQALRRPLRQVVQTESKHRFTCVGHIVFCGSQKSLPGGLQIFAWQFHLIMTDESACLGGAVDSVAVRTAWLRWSASLGSRPRLAESLCQVIAAYALRLNSRAGTEGSTVSSLICDRWLILSSEALSISRCLNHW